MIAGFIALGIDIVDEIYQSSVPCRDASVTDVLLGAIGIVVAILLMIQFYKKHKFSMLHHKK